MRDEGFYWVRVAEGDSSQSQWMVAEFANGEWGLPRTNMRLGDDEMAMIGPRLLNPDETAPAVTAEMIEDGWSTFRNSSWHELDPTVIDKVVGLNAFEEVFKAMDMARPRPVFERDPVLMQALEALQHAGGVGLALAMSGPKHPKFDELTNEIFNRCNPAAMALAKRIRDSEKATA